MIKKGIAASSGIAIGKVLKYINEALVVEERKVDDAKKELERLNDAMQVSKEQLAAIQVKAAQELSEEEAMIFEAHAMMLEDPEFLGGIENEIESNQVNAEWAVQNITNMFYAMFEAMDDPYFKARAADIQDVGGRVLKNLMGVQTADISSLDGDVILIAEDLAPSDTAQMDKKHILAFATDVGSRTSHTAIMARSLEIPAVLGLIDICDSVNDGDMIIVDGISGEVLINPDEATVQEYENKKNKYEDYRRTLSELKELPAQTKDGHEVIMAGNIGSPEDVDGVLRNGGDGVGLYRTEFLYMNSDVMPDEQTQYEAYKKVIEQFQNHGVIIRTLDIGGDKTIPYLPLEKEMNPFLGLRAVRLCFKREDIFKTQLRAILRASVYGPTKVMFPMISSIGEVRQAKAIVEECMAELDRENIAYDKNIKIGIMIEIPSAAMMADVIEKEVDFFSIGTNDLCQYSLAVDRMNPAVSYLYDPLNPAILRLVKRVIEATENVADKFTGMCGEMAGDPYATLVLLGMGLDEFSMSATSIPQIKKIIRSVDMEIAKEIADKALMMESGEEVKAMVEEKLAELGIDVL